MAGAGVLLTEGEGLLLMDGAGLLLTEGVLLPCCILKFLEGVLCLDGTDILPGALCDLLLVKLLLFSLRDEGVESCLLFCISLEGALFTLDGAVFTLAGVVTLLS